MLNTKFVTITLVAMSFPCTADTKTNYIAICTCGYPNKILTDVRTSLYDD